MSSTDCLKRSLGFSRHTRYLQERADSFTFQSIWVHLLRLCARPVEDKVGKEGDTVYLYWVQ